MKRILQLKDTVVIEDYGGQSAIAITVVVHYDGCVSGPKAARLESVLIEDVLTVMSVPSAPQTPTRVAEAKYQACSASIAAVHEATKDAPAQRTPEWYALRPRTIGGSEIATLLGYNSFSSPKKLVAQKVGLTHFNGNTACRWGKIFEPVTTTLTEVMLNMDQEIAELGSLPGCVPGQRYSPDGMGVVWMPKTVQDYNKKTRAKKYRSVDWRWMCILFEFKAPYSGYAKSKRIPRNYEPQVLTGLASIKSAERGIFISNIYRRCSLPELNFDSQYNRTYHHRDGNKTMPATLGKHSICTRTPVAVGMVIFYHDVKVPDDGDDNCDDDSDGEYDMTEAKSGNGAPDMGGGNDYDSTECTGFDDVIFSGNAIDMGNCSSAIFEHILRLYDDGEMKELYLPPVVCQEGLEEGMDSNWVLQKCEAAVPLDEATRRAAKFGAALTHVKGNIEKVPGRRSQRPARRMAAYLPWKNFHTYIRQRDPEPGYADTLRGPVAAALAAVSTILDGEPTADDIQARYDEAYPPPRPTHMVVDVETESEMTDEDPGEGAVIAIDFDDD